MFIIEGFRRSQACSELGYYLACLEAALAYVVDATEASLGAQADERASFGSDASRSRNTSDAPSASESQLSSAAQLARADDVREQLASFLHEERVVDELVASLTL